MSAPSAPQYPVQSASPSSTPGRVLGIVGFIVAFFLSIVGLILSIVALVQSRRAGVPNGFAIAGIVVGAVRVLADVVAIILFVVLIGGVIAHCADLGPGMHHLHGITYTCNG